jgi:hypothetical protein
MHPIHSTAQLQVISSCMVEYFLLSRTYNTVCLRLKCTFFFFNFFFFLGRGVGGNKRGMTMEI